MKLEKRDFYWAIPYAVPFIFLAMWLDWCWPAFHWAGLILMVAPVCGLAWQCGRTGKNIAFWVGNFLNFYVNQMCIFMAGRQLPEEAAAQWKGNFAPATVEETFLKWFVSLLLVQITIFLLMRRFRKK